MNLAEFEATLDALAEGSERLPVLPPEATTRQGSFLFYNTEPQHQSLDYRTPQEVYEGQETGCVRTQCAA